MTTIRVLMSRVLDLLFSGRRERRLEEEIANHLDLLTQHYVAAGMAPADARRAAQREFGGVERIKEAYRDQRGLPLLDTLARDFGFAVRLMRRNPSFAVTAVLVLGIGIGVNNMLFTILNAHTIRGLPIPQSGRVLFISSVDAKGADRGVSFADFDDIRSSTRQFAGIAAFRGMPMVVTGDGHAPERLDGAYATPSAFTLLRIEPVHGRGFLESDDAVGAAPVALLSRNAWLARYGGDPAVLGRAVTINGAPSTIVGIVPDASGFPGTAAIWMPLQQAPGLRTEGRDARTLQVFGRLTDRADAGEAGAEIAAIAERLANDHSGHQPQRARPRVSDQRTIPRQPDRSRLARVHDGRLHRRPDLLRERRQPDDRSVGAALTRAGDSCVGGRQPRQAAAAAARRERRDCCRRGRRRTPRRDWRDPHFSQRDSRRRAALLARLLRGLAGAGRADRCVGRDRARLRTAAVHSGLEERRHHRAEGRRPFEHGQPAAAVVDGISCRAGRTVRRPARTRRGGRSFEPDKSCLRTRYSTPPRS